MPAAASMAASIVVSTAPAFFNPSLGQTAQIRVVAGTPGVLQVEVLDRDRFVIRTLPPHDVDGAGETVLRWDGKDNSGEVVPNEAYVLRALYTTRAGVETVDPGLDFVPVSQSLTDISYSRQDGVLGYRLERASRVHIQAGQARPNPKGGPPEGPVLRTLVDRQPRVAGSVIETWNGLDESGGIYVPDLPDFAIAVFATSLADTTLITVGNRGKSFVEYALAKRPRAGILPRTLPEAAHLHAGLNALEDRSPALTVEPTALFDTAKGVWQVSGKLLVTVTVEPSAAPYFLSQPTELALFVDGKRVLHVKRPANPVELSIAEKELPPGEHRIVVNWASGSGPVGVNAFKVSVAAKTAGKENVK